MKKQLRTLGIVALAAVCFPMICNAEPQGSTQVDSGGPGGPAQAGGGANREQKLGPDGLPTRPKIRERLLEKFDANKDGKLTGDELEKAKAFMRERRERRQARMQQKGGGGLGAGAGLGASAGAGANANAGPGAGANAGPGAGANANAGPGALGGNLGNAMKRRRARMQQGGAQPQGAPPASVPGNGS